jgi:hypothetical protein
MAHARKTHLDTATMTRFAVESDTCLRSWVKVLSVDDPGVVRGLAGHRIRNYLHSKGLAHLAPQMFREALGSVANVPGPALDPDDAAEDETRAIAV